MKASTGRDSLLVFARNPVAGRVKTRLIPALGAATAGIVYMRMLQDTLACAAQVAAGRRELWVDHPSPDARLMHLAEIHDLSVHLQTGPDLGARMYAALHASLQDADRAVLIGTDCPGCDAAYLDAAFRALERHDAVIGPAADGGYVLIGLRRVTPDLFADIPWSSDRVLAATRERLASRQWNWVELSLQHDVDEPGDLLRFPHLAALAGMQPLQEHGT